MNFPGPMVLWIVILAMIGESIISCNDVNLDRQMENPLIHSTPPVPIPLWDRQLFEGSARSLAEQVNKDSGIIENVSEPALSLYLPEQNNTGVAVVVFPGGGYQVLDWKTHVVYAANVFNQMGMAVIGLKYRTRPPNRGSNEDIQAIALQDAKRALRMVRNRAREWRIDPDRIGVAGYSAGANLALNLASHFDAGEISSNDPIERESSRPDFVIGIATWHWQQKALPYSFNKDMPPVFLVHAIDDSVAPVELPRAIEKDLRKLNVPVRLEIFAEGGHGVGDLHPERLGNHDPAAHWPQHFQNWYQALTVSSFQTHFQ